MGRRKIQIQPLTDDRNRTVTFVKRKAGLFKKAHELAVLCQVDLAVIIIGNNNKLYEFSSVDTKEIMNVYKNVKTPYESKSPENYGNYKKKKHLRENTSKGLINDDIAYGEEEEEEVDSEYDSDTPEPKRQKRKFSEINNKYYNGISSERPQHPPLISLSNVPSFNSSFRQKNSVTSKDEDTDHSIKAHKKEDSLSKRPVLRVQIPSGSKGTLDSAKTITALDTNIQTNVGPNSVTPDSASSSNLKSGGQSLPNINTKFSNFPSLPGVPNPLHPKSQTSSPSSATAPPLPISGIPFFSSMPQGSPSNQYNGNSILPTPILNQVLQQQFIPHNHQYGHNHSQQSTNESNSNDANEGTSFESANNDSQQGNETPMNKNINVPANSNTANPSGPSTGNKFRSPMFTNGHYVNGEHTPVSGLPSRYVNDIFPSPSNFYAPQDWPNPGTGMTPIHNSIPQYFMNMLPSGAPGPNNPNSYTARPQAHLQQGNQAQPGKNESLPSPFQYMNGSFNANASSNSGGPHTNFQPVKK